MPEPTMVIASRTGRYDTAKENLGVANAWYRKNQQDSRNAADNYFELGAVYLLSGEEQRARELWQGAIEQFSALDQTWVEPWLGHIHNDLGIASEFLGDFESARQNYLLSIQYSPDKLSLESATQLGNLASAERKIGNTDQAIELLNQSLQMHYDVVGPDHKEVSMILSDLSLALVDGQQKVPALSYSHQALDNALMNSGEMHRNTAAAYFAVGNAELINGHFDQARQALQQALIIRQELLGDGHPRTLDVAISLAEVNCYAGSQNKGHAELTQIIEDLSNRIDKNQFYLQRAKQKLSICQ